MIDKIRFGTEGWRGIINEDFNEYNLLRVTEAIAKWINSNFTNARILLANDSRNMARAFMEMMAAKFYERKIITTIAQEDFVSTPMLSLAVVKEKMDIGIMVTASHNPSEYLGIKIKSSQGAPIGHEAILKIESLIQDAVKPSKEAFKALSQANKISDLNLTQIYFNHVNAQFDLSALSSYNILYDVMYGAGQHIAKKIFPKATFYRAELKQDFGGIKPEPIEENLVQLKNKLLKKNFDIGFATDGDADRIAVFDADGNYIDIQDVILLLIYYYGKIKKKNAIIIYTYSCSDKIKTLGDYLAIKTKQCGIGFKNIYAIIKENNGNFLIGAEESGGIALYNHLPERDGIWVALSLIEILKSTQTQLSDLIAEIRKIVGHSVLKRKDLHIQEEKKQQILSYIEQGNITQLGKQKIIRQGSLDGHKLYLQNGSWVLIRASGTEPLLRIYIEAESLKEVEVLQENMVSVIQRL